MNPLLTEFLQREPFKNGMTPELALAANVLWRDHVPLTQIARALGVARNTLYYKVTTGHAPSYPHTASNWAAAVNDVVEAVGVNKIRREFVTPKILQAIEDAEQRKAINAARAA